MEIDFLVFPCYLFRFLRSSFSSSALLPTLLVKLFIFCNDFCVTVFQISTQPACNCYHKMRAHLSHLPLHGFTSLFSLEREEHDLATVCNSSLAFLADFRFSFVQTIEALALSPDFTDRSSTMKYLTILAHCLQLVQVIVSKDQTR